MTEPRLPGEPTASVMRTTLLVLGLVLGAIAVLWALFRLQGILFLVFLAILFRFVLDPLIELLRRPIHLGGRSYALPLPGAIAVIYLLLFGSLAMAIVLLLPALNDQITDLMKDAPGQIARVQSQWQAWEKSHTPVLPRSMRAGVDHALQTLNASGVEYVKSQALSRLGAWLASVPWLVLVPILTFFIIKDAEFFRQSFLESLSGRRLKRRGDLLFEDINRALAAYIRAQLLAGVIVGVACTAAFLAIGLPYAVVLGVLAGLLEFIPLAGPLAIGLLSVGVGALQSLGQAAIVMAFLLVLRVIQDYVVYPRLVGGEVRLHPLAVILAIVCGGELAGIAGIFAAVPILIVFLVTYRHLRAHRQQEAAASSQTGMKSA